MKISAYIIAALLMVPLGATANPLRGGAALLQLEDLPSLRRGVSVHQQSSFDRSGDNSDRNCWLYRDGQGDYVIFDDFGAGCIYRFWMTHGGVHPDYSANYTTNHVKIYLDDDVDPRFECSIEEFFSGTFAPFLAPLAGSKSVSSGGMYSYVPIPYRSRCRIALTDIPPVSMRDAPWGTDSYWMYYNITYHKYASTDNVVSWTGLEDMVPLQSLLSQTYTDPKTESADWVFSGEVSPAGHSSEDLISLTGTGVVNSITLNIEGLDEDLMSDLWLRIYWDDDPEPAVEAPVGAFFAAGKLTNAVVGSQMVGRYPGGGFYCYYPMPFWGSTRINLENRGSTASGVVSFSVGVGNRLYPSAETGHFYAHYSTQSFTNYVGAPDFTMLDETGRGHVVGAALFGAGGGKIYNNGLAYLEGDERVYIDGSLTPQLHGTGLEDYFNAGWYFNNGTFSLPYHGSPVRALPYGMGVETNYVGAYRLHIGDVIPFNESISMGIEHGGRNEVGCTFSSVVCYYMRSDAEPGLTDCAQLDVGQGGDELAYSYAGDGFPVITNVYAYTGDDHDLLLEDDGRLSSTGSSFQVSIPSDNDGLLIRRRIDTGLGRQSARVRVDGEAVGDWVFLDGSYTNVDQRWRDEEFRVPFGYTAGKSNVVLSFECLPDSEAWSEYRYSVCAVKPLVEDGDMDADGMDDTWEVEYFGSIMNGLAGADLDHDGFSNGDEFICLTDPVDGSSYFLLGMTNGTVQAFYFDTSAARTYRIMLTTNLMQDAWEVIETVAGDESRVVYPLSGALETPEFYKVSVDLE